MISPKLSRSSSLGATPDRPRLLAAADALAEEIWTRRQSDVKGGLTWLAPRKASPAEPFLPTPIDPFLYSGKVGIALFFAAAARVLGNVEYRDRSLQTVASLRSQAVALAADRKRAERSKLGLGGTFGIGALIYSFARIGTLLGEQDLISDAHALTRLLTRERIAGDRLLDVVLGAAGAILALLALDEVAPQANQDGETPLDLAQACANHLLARRVSFEDRPRAWETISGHPPLSGFSHGAAGICYALLRLYSRTKRSDLLAAAEEGIAFERSTYSPRRRNWRDMRVRDAARPRYLTNWCHGAPGIALGRLGALDVYDDREVQDEIESALATTTALPLTPIDHVCCGNVGRAEVLLYAGQRLGAPRHLDAALDLAGEVLRRAQGENRFGWLPEGEVYQFDPAFFNGAAGVGYSFLRIAEPDVLPCALLLA